MLSRIMRRAARLVLVVYCGLTAYSTVHAQGTDITALNDYKGQPEVWHMDRPLDPGVDAYGDLSLAIPIMTVPGRGFDFDITFNYRAGIPVEQRAGWIGLGWSFDPGSISRDPEGGMNWDVKYGVDVFDDPAEARALPDIYHISLPGRGTVEATQISNSNFNRPLVPEVQPGDFVVNEHTPWRITPTQDGPVKVHFQGDSSYPWLQTGEREASYPLVPMSDIRRFVVTVEDGTRYVFDKPSLAVFETAPPDGNDPWIYRQFYVDTWRLVAILGPDYTRPIPAQLADSLEKNLVWPAEDDPGSWVRIEYDVMRGHTVGGLDPENVYMSTYVKAIHTPTHKAVFTTVQGPQEPFNSALQPFLNRRLTTIELYSKLTTTPQVVQATGLVQADATQDGLGPTGNGVYRLRLDGLQMTGYQGASRNGYAFFYGYNPTDNVANVENCIDDMGYLRESEACLDNDIPDPKGGTAWNLTRIVHPSGAVDSLAYETDWVNGQMLLDFTFNLSTDPAPFYCINIPPSTIPGYPNGCVMNRRIRQGGSRLVTHTRTSGMGDTLRTTYSYGKGYLTGIPLRAWGDLLVNTVNPGPYRIYAPSNRGKIAIVYDSVEKTYWNGSAEVGSTLTTYTVHEVGPIIAHTTAVAGTNGTDIVTMQASSTWSNGRILSVTEKGPGIGREVQKVIEDCSSETYSPHLAHIWTSLAAPAIQIYVKQVNHRCDSRKTYRAGSTGAPGLVKEVHYTYDPATGMVATITEVGSGRNRLTKTMRAYEAYDGAGGMKERNMLSQVGREEVYEVSGSALTDTALARSTVTAWKSFSGSQGASFWKPYKAYNWRDDNGDGQEPFFSYADSTQIGGEWKRTYTSSWYDTTGNLKIAFDARGEKIELEYDSRYASALLKKATRSDFSVELRYDPVHAKVDTLVDESGTVRVFEYDSFGRLSRLKNTGGKKIAGYEYFDFESSAEPNRTKTTQYLDDTNAIISWALADGLARPVQGQTREENTAIVTTMLYDGAGRPWKTYKPYRHNASGVFQDDYEEKAVLLYGCASPYVTTTYHPDPLQRAAAVTPECSSASVTTSYAVEDTYFSTLTTDEENKSRRVTTDLFGQTVKAVNAVGTSDSTVTLFEYDVLGNVTKVTDPRSFVTSYTYNTLGQLTQKVSPDAGTTSYVYDIAGNLRKVQDAVRRENALSSDPAQHAERGYLYYDYDRHNRVVESGLCVNVDFYPDEYASIGPACYFNARRARVIYTYDTANPSRPSPLVPYGNENDEGNGIENYVGRLVQVEFDGGFYQYSYDREGRVARMYVGLDGFVGKQIAYEYDRQGNLTHVAYQEDAEDEFHLWYEYDLAGRLETLKSNRLGDKATAQREVRYAYNAAGQVERQWFGPNAAVIPVDSLKYHVRGWLRALNDASSQPNAFNLGLTYEDNGNVSSVEWATQREDGTAGDRLRYTYGYDSHNRLLSADYAKYSSGTWLPNDITYDVGVPSPIEYDGNGNITRLVRNGLDAQGQSTIVSQLDYAYDGNNRLASISGAIAATFAYDANGNVLLGRGGRLMEYDHRNLLKTVSDSLRYVYDAQGQRIAKRRGTGGAMTPSEFYVRGADGAVLAVYGGDFDLKHWNLLSGGAVIGQAGAGRDEAPMPAPALVSPANTAAGMPTQLSFSWNNVPAAETYTLEVSKKSDFKTTVVDTWTAATSITVDGLENGKTYYWRVLAASRSTASGWSAPRQFATASVPPPPAPTLTSPADYSDDIAIPATLDWDEAPGATFYWLQVATDAGFTHVVNGWQHDYGATEAHNESLQHGTTYYWRVSAMNGGGPGEWSSTRRFTTGYGPINDPPAVPQLVAPIATCISGGGTCGLQTPGDPRICTLLSWATVYGATSYDWEVASDYAFGSIVESGNSTGTSTSVLLDPSDPGRPPLEPASVRYYYWRVRALNNAGMSNWSTSEQFSMPFPDGTCGGGGEWY